MTTDALRVQQIYMNVLQNALKYSSYNSKISIQADFKSMGHSNRNMLEISVKDHGVGITEDQLETIFDSQFTSKTLRSGYQDNMKRRSMSLSLCKYIIENLGGDILINSQINKKTVVTICVPVFFGQPND